MPENIPNIPGGAFPPKKETGKVQPKKETVRINLPPKPSTAPTIKLPAVPPGGTGAGSMGGTAASAAPAPAPGSAAPAHAAAPFRGGAAAPAVTRGTPVSHAVPAPAAAEVSTLDVMLAMAAAIVGLAALGTTIWMWQL